MTNVVQDLLEVKEGQLPKLESLSFYGNLDLEPPDIEIDPELYRQCGSQGVKLEVRLG